jgi:6-pyruvoyltetrahydropterin/6-carboxytetrahydropterin synthase
MEEKKELPFVTVSKTMSFASAHRLPFYNGKCYNWHGHEWKVKVSIKKRIDLESGMVFDFSELKKVMSKHIIELLDHNVLNNYVENPTAENLLLWIWKQLVFKAKLEGVESISIWESPDSVAILERKDVEFFLRQESNKGEKV